ncbi:MAG: maltokinase N-terminal cap-like domain-containing protein [Acidimicrobiales bacterium]
MSIDPSALGVLLPSFLPRQRWFSGEDADDATIDELEILETGSPMLLWLLIDAAGVNYQLFVGLRPLEQAERFLEGKGLWLLGDIDTDEGPQLAYDALVDPDLARRILALTAPDAAPERVRPLAAEQSNSSVVFDEQIILKLFRKVERGRNPDVELPGALTAAGFPHIAATVGEWHRDGRDLAVARTFLEGGGDGWQLALTSLRDIYMSRVEPAEAGGDIGPEASRLGHVTAEMHVALGSALGVSDATPVAWADAMRRVAGTDADMATALALYEVLRDVGDAGSAIRIHGDLHLGQVVRTDAGWYVLDFEGEPAISIAERRLPTSPLRDVAGMLRSFHYAAEVALRDQGVAVDDELRGLAHRWEAHACGAFLEGYSAVDGIAALLPASEADRRTVLDAFIAAKAVYEVAYERAHRPEWADIPLTALARLGS